MRNLKYVMVIMVIFALVLSACSTDERQEGAGDTAYPAVTDTTGLGANANDTGLNGNVNENGNLNGNDNGLGADATATPLSMATPLGTAMGTPAATQDVAVTTEAVGPLSTETPAVDAQTTPMVTAGADDLQTYENGILLSNLIGAEIVNTAGDGWGVVDSAILDQATCTVPYLLVQVNGDMLDNAAAPNATNANDNSSGAATTGTPGATDGTTATESVDMGNNTDAAVDGDMVLVPLSAFFAEGQQGVLSLPLTISDKVAQTVLTAPRYTEDSLPDWATPGWDADLRTVWAGYPALTGGGSASDANANGNGNDNAAESSATMTNAAAVRLTDVTDVNVTNANGDDLGDIENVVVMLNNQPAYVFLAVGGILDIGERLIPLPCDLVSWQMDENGALNVVINADKQMLEGAPSLDEIPAMFDDGWNAEYATYWTGAAPVTTPAVTATP